MKRIKLLLAMAACVAVLVGTVVLGSPYAPPVGPYREIEEIWAIEDARTQSTTPLITQMDNFGERLGYDVDYNTFYCPIGIPQDGEWPEIDLTVPGAKGVNVCFVDDYSYDWCDEAVREGYNYQLIAYTDTEFSYCDIVFTGLPVINLTTEDELGADYDTPVHVELTGGLDTTARAHKRGQTSLRDGSKHGLKIEFTRSTHGTRKVTANVPGIGATDEIVLIPCFADRDLMRDKLSWDLYSGITSEDEPFGPRKTQYIELFRNDLYQGVYVMIQPYDLAEEIAKLDAAAPASDRVYRTASTMPIENRPMIKDSSGVYYKLYYAADTDDDPFAELREFIALMEEPDDAAFIEKAEKMLDLDNVLRYGLFVQAGGMTDSIRNNMYILAHHAADGVIYSFGAWDMDVSWGRDDEADSEVWYPFDLFDRLIELDVAGSRARLAEIWAGMRESVFTHENVESLITQYTQALGGTYAFGRNAELWGGALTTPDAHYISEYAGFRFEMMDRRIEEICSDALADRRIRIEGFTTFDEGALADIGQGKETP